MTKTRIQEKSRPTKRPMAYENGNVRSGIPKTDKKGYPATEGVPIPVLVKGEVVFPTPPAGLVMIGTGWYTSSFASSEDGTISVSGVDLTIADNDSGGNDVSATIQALSAGETIWLASAGGATWSAEIVTVTDESGVTIIEFDTPVGVFQGGYNVIFAAGTPT